MGIFDGILNAITPGVGSLLGGALGFFGQEDTNQTNIDIANQANVASAAQAEANRAFQADQAQINRSWQQAMSDTAMSRRVADLKNAGLNPMLAYNDAASSPGGGVPSGAQGQVHVPQIGNKYAAGVSAAQAAAANQQTYAQIRNVEADTELKDSQRIQTLASAGHLNATEASIRQEMTGFETRMMKVMAETTGADWRALRDKTQAELNRYAFNELNPAMREKIAAEATKLRNEARLLDLKVPEAIMEASYWSGPQGPVGVHMRHSPGIDRLVTGTVTKGAEELHRAGSAFQLKNKMSDDQSRVLREYGSQR